MTLLLTVDHSDCQAISKGADDFAAFYLAVFYEDALIEFTNRRRKNYSMVLAFIALLMVLGIMPLLTGSTSVFAYILLFLGIAMMAGIVFCFLRIRDAEAYCKENIRELFDSQLRLAQGPDHVVVESRFYEDRLEQLIGISRGAQKSRVRNYKDIPKVFVTDSLYFFQGAGWVPKALLTVEETEMLDSILASGFKTEDVVFARVGERVSQECGNPRRANRIQHSERSLC